MKNFPCLRRKPRCETARRRSLLLCLIATIALGLTAAAIAQGPQWWTNGVLDDMAVTNDYAPANAGQLKNMAWQAYREMQANLPGGAGSDVSNVVYGLTSGGDFSPVNIGQLKYVAHPFYSKLIAMEYANAYPWAGTPETNDYALANIGQVKSVFGFEIPNGQGPDSDGDGMPDWWESLYAGLDPNDPLDANGDLDGDGLTNLREYLYRANPLSADSDNDGFADGEDTEPTDLYVWNHTAQIGYPNSAVSHPTFSAIHRHPAGDHATGYELQVADDPDFTQVMWSPAGGDQVVRPWSRIWGASGYLYDFAFRPVVDSQGNVFVAMATEGSLDGQTNAGGRDIALCRFDARGQRGWTRMFGSSALEKSKGIVLDEARNCLYVAGETWGGLDGPNAGSGDACLAKYTTDGDLQWIHQFGTNTEERVVGGVVNSGGDVFVAYATGNVLPQRLFLKKFTSAGAEVWTIQLSTNLLQGYAYPWGAVTVDSQDQLFVSWSEITDVSTWDCRVAVSKRNSDGSEDWTATVVAGAFATMFRSACMTAQDEILIDMEGADGERILKVSTSSGEVEWSAAVPESVFSLMQITADGDGYVYAVGIAENNGAFDPYALKLNADGEVVWTHSWGSGWDDQAMGVAVDAWGNVYVAGGTQGAFDGQTNLWPGNYHAFLSRLNQAGGALAIGPVADGARSPDIQYDGPPLGEGRTNYWRIRFFDSSGLPGDWSTGDNWFVFHADTDDDGMPDWWETLYFDGPTNAVASADSDGDDLNNMAEYQQGTNPTESDTDGDGLLDGWEIQNGLDPLDDGSTDPNNGAAGDLDGDGFDNALEFELGAPANNPAWNGEELAYRLMHAHDAARSASARTAGGGGLRVDIDDSADCGGSAGTQNKTDDLVVPALLKCGYYIDIGVAGLVEDVDVQYDKVSIEAYSNTFYFSGHYNRPTECRMVGDSATCNVLIMANSTVKLRYNTVSYKWHSGAYAEIVSASYADTYQVEIAGAEAICLGDTTILTASGGAGAPYTWTSSANSIATVNSSGEVTGVAPGRATITATDGNGCSANMVLDVVNYDISIDPESPWAGDVVTYSLAPGYYIPPNYSIQWTAPNDYYECISDATLPPTTYGGQFRIPNHMSGDYTVTASASCGNKYKTVTSQCKDCTGLVSDYNDAFTDHQLIRDQAESHIDDIWLLSYLQGQYRSLGIKLGACLTIYAYANLPPNPWGKPTQAVESFLSNLSNNMFIPDMKALALQLAGEMDLLAASIKPLQDAYTPMYCEYRSTYGAHKQTHSAATGCIMSVEAKKLCQSILNELPVNSKIQEKAGYPCEIVNPNLLLHLDNWMVYDTLTFFGVAAYQLNNCN